MSVDSIRENVVRRRILLREYGEEEDTVPATSFWRRGCGYQ